MLGLLNVSWQSVLGRLTVGGGSDGLLVHSISSQLPLEDQTWGIHGSHKPPRCLSCPPRDVSLSSPEAEAHRSPCILKARQEAQPQWPSGAGHQEQCATLLFPLHLAAER